jgi:hypothetical protein
MLTDHHLLTTSSRVRPVAVIVTAVALAVALVPAARAAGFSEVPFEEGGFYYGDLDTGVLLFSGESAEGFCDGDDVVHDARLFEGADGSLTFKVDDSTQPLYLYATPLDAPVFADATCAALAAGEPIVEPFATGEGTVRMRLTVNADGTLHMVNSAIGAVTDTDGATWRVRGHADLMIVDGVPVGHPSDFQGLQYTLTGP